MPMYEYKCSSCGKVFELIQKFSDEPLTTHPECGGAVQRLVSAPALQFKGTGWYITDYAKKSGTNGSSSSKDSSSSTSKDSGGESKSKSDSPAPASSSTSSSSPDKK